MEKRGVQSGVAHYIDDFITLGAPGSDQCSINADLMHAACGQLGLPIEPEKDEGRATTIPFLGIELDSTAMEVRLPPKKLIHLREVLAAWKQRKACKKRELLSLIGLLSRAAMHGSLIPA